MGREDDAGPVLDVLRTGYAMSRGGARPGAGRPRIYADGLRRSVTMMRGHWDGLALLARMVGSTPSGVLCALVEQAVADAAAAVGDVGAAEVEE